VNTTSASKGFELFDKNVRKAFVDPLIENNPVTVQILGVCSSLAVTTQVKQALLMGVGVTLCTALGNVVLAAMRNWIPSSIRIIVPRRDLGPRHRAR